MKRILLFLATNLAIMITLSIVLCLLGIGGYRLPGGGLDYSALMVFCLVWGMGGAFISLALSRFIAKRAMGVQLVDGRTGREELDWLHGTVRQLTDRAGLPMPEVGFYDSPEVNAFATGPSRTARLWPCPRACCVACGAKRSKGSLPTRCRTSRTATW